MHTDRRAATAAEVKAWRERYADSWNEPQSVKNGTLSLEYLEASKRRAAGWYFTLRRQTMSRYASIEEMNENGDITGYIRTADIYADSLAAVEALEDIASGLPPRDRLFIAAFCSIAAERAAGEAHAAYMADKTHTHAESRAAEAAYKARIAYAAERVGVGAKHRAEYVDRIRRHVAAAAKVEHTCTTPTEFAEHDRAYWKHMQADSRRGCNTDRAPRPDCLVWIDRAESAPAAPIISWLTAEEAKARRAEQANPDTSAKPADFDARCIRAAVDRYSAAVNTLALPAIGQTAASVREAERIARAASRHPNATPETLTTPESPKAAHDRRMREQWDRYLDATPRRPKAAPMTDAERAAKLAALNTPEKCAERLAAMKSRREYLFGK